MNQPLVTIGLMGVAAIGLLSGCGTTKITADTTCADYLEHPGNVRHDAATRISSELGVQGAGNPMWALSLDYYCGSSREDTIGAYFDRQKGR